MNAVDRFVIVILLSGALFFSLFYQGVAASKDENGMFTKVVIDTNGPEDPWGKAFGDINGDGKPDLLVAGRRASESGFLDKLARKLISNEAEIESPGLLVWYENPSMKKHVVSERYAFRTDLEVVDMDADGDNDIVSLTDSGLIWFRNPDWEPFVIDTKTLHDIEAVDLDSDGDVDVVARNQRLFAQDDRGDTVHLYFRESGEKWSYSSLAVPPGEGLQVADLNADSRPDIIVNGNWYRNTGQPGERPVWQAVRYSRGWDWADVKIATADLNGDNAPDIVLAPSEPAGERYRMSWFAAPAEIDGEWNEHIIETDVESVRHALGCGDFNGDGLVDIVTAEMHQGQDPDAVSIYWNLSFGGNRWRKEIIATTGSHNIEVFDFDKDGDLDFFGANWSGEHQDVVLWMNRSDSGANPLWRRHVIDFKKPWTSVFVMSADLDGDGKKDIVTGGWWYRNPGRLSGTWERKPLGRGLNNVALVADFNQDGCPDILASAWKGNETGVFDRRYVPGDLLWGENDCSGDFQVLRNIQGGQGDFLQGVGLMSFQGASEVVLSWHEEGDGVQTLTVPDHPERDDWVRETISEDSQDEDISIADLDHDGRPDVLLGTRWLRSGDDGRWTLMTISAAPGNPDRNKAVDLDADGQIEVIVGFEAISRPGRLAWYKRENTPEFRWTEHVIDEIIGPMSLDAHDMDGDGDPDIIVGEHNLDHPETARIMWYENINIHENKWGRHLIHTGDEHHDGAHVADLDNDGDPDIVSIGWGHDRLIVYENLQNRPGGK